MADELCNHPMIPVAGGGFLYCNLPKGHEGGHAHQSEAFTNAGFRPNTELLTALDELVSAVQDGLRRHAAGDPNAIASNLISATLRQADQALQKMKWRRDP